MQNTIIEYVQNMVIYKKSDKKSDCILEKSWRYFSDK